MLVLLIVGLAGAVWACGGAVQPPAAAHALWRSPLAAGGDPPSGTPATDATRLFVVAGAVQAYALGTGELLWQRPLHTYVPRSLLAVSGLLIVPEATVSALDAATGRPVWEFTPDANVSLGRAATDGRAVYVGTASHRVTSLGIADGRPLWTVDLGPEWTDQAVVRGIAVAGGTVYAAVEQWRDPHGRTSAGWLVALEASTGHVLWRSLVTEGEPRGGLSSAPAVTDRLVIAGDFLANALIAVDRASGHPVWRFSGEAGRPGFPEAPIVAGGAIYAGSGDTYAYSLTLDGALRWRTRLPSSIGAYASCGRGLLLNDQGLTVVDPGTGRVLQRGIDDGEFPTSGLAVRGRDAFLLGPKAVYAYRCT